MDKTDKVAWGQWLQGVLVDTLAGTGLRPEVEYLPPVYEEVRRKPGDDSEPEKKKTKDGRYRITIICPLEWKVTNWVSEEDITMEKVQEIIGDTCKLPWHNVT